VNELPPAPPPPAGALTSPTFGFIPQAPPASAQPAQRHGTFFRCAGPPGHCLSLLHGRRGWYVDNIGCYFVRYTPDRWSLASHRLMLASYRASIRHLVCHMRLGREAAAAGEQNVLQALPEAVQMVLLQTLGDMECAGYKLLGNDDEELAALPAAQLRELWLQKGGGLVVRPAAG
jgi:hypothetical protein